MHAGDSLNGRHGTPGGYASRQLEQWARQFHAVDGFVRERLADAQLKVERRVEKERASFMLMCKAIDVLLCAKR